jgi:hypothetical protein
MQDKENWKCGLQEHGTSITQFTSVHSTANSRVLSKVFNSCPILSRLFLSPKIKNYPERKNISNSRGHHYEHNRRTRVSQETFLKQSFQAWKRWWEWYTSAQGNYFGGDKCNCTVSLEKSYYCWIPGTSWINFVYQTRYQEQGWRIRIANLTDPY